MACRARSGLGDDGTFGCGRSRNLKPFAAMCGCGRTTWPREQTRQLDGVVGDACELQLEIEPGTAARVGVKVRAASDGKEETLIYYDFSSKELVFDATRSGRLGRT